MKKIVCCIASLISIGWVAGQVSNVGKLISWKRTNNGIEATTASGLVEVKAWSDQIIRVRVTNHSSFNPLIYALAPEAAPQKGNYTVQQNGTDLLLQTAALDVVIETQPAFRITFKNKAGVVLNEDVAGSCFGTTFISDKVSVYKKIQEGERFIGLGEALGNLDRRGTGVWLNNTDTYKYGDPRLQMYSSVPFYMGIHHQQQYGIFFNNSYPTFFNFGLSTPQFASINMEGGDADYFLCYDTTVAGVLQQYTQLTGRMSLPPQWSMGYHQSRCSYYPQSKVSWIAQSFRSKKIPLDCIVLDADYQQGYQPFRVNKQRFPDMPGLAKELAGMNIELTASVYPGVKIDSSYESYRDGLQKDIFLKYADGSLFETEIAPLKVYLPDYTNPKGRAWWIGKMKWLEDNGIRGYWNDMNEPAVGGSYLPDNVSFDFDGKKANALAGKNLYGFQMARSSYEAALQHAKGHRPFVLTRSGFAGVQRYAAVWSGDNTSKDEYLLSGVLLNNTMGLSGIPFVGYDLGGYIGDASKDLFKRWIEVGIFSPFCRNHREFFGLAGEPWAYGEEAEAIAKNYIEFRYRLMPYLYGAFYTASQTGLPIARSLSIAYPHDARAYDNNYQYQFLFGDALLVVPVTSQEKSKKVWLPAGEWYQLYSNQKLSGNQELTEETPIYQLPLYAKAGSIIPVQHTVQSTKEQPGDTIQLHVYYGAESNTYQWYMDAGDGMNYQQGVYAKRFIQFDPATQQINVAAQEGRYASPFKYIRWVLHGFPARQSLLVNNQPITTQTSSLPLLDPLTYLDEVYDPAYFGQLKSASVYQADQTVTIPFNHQAIQIKW